MNGKEQALAKEAIALLESYGKDLILKYPEIRERFINRYEWPELDTLRHEVCLCYLSGCNQAGIVLTNHLLETFVKSALIRKRLVEETSAAQPNEFLNKSLQTAEGAIAKFDELQLGDAINRACTAGIIDKEEKKQLHELREKFRNLYSHANRQKMFNGITLPVHGGTISPDHISWSPPQTVELTNFLTAHWWAKMQHAETFILEYFFALDGLIRKVRERLYGPLAEQEGPTKASPPDQ